MAPSEYVRRHVRLALQPVDGPGEPAALLHLIDQLESEDR